MRVLFLLLFVCSTVSGCGWVQEYQDRQERKQRLEQSQQEAAQNTEALKREIQEAQESGTADYGNHPSNYQELAKAYINARLKDSDSAKYRFPTQPEKSYVFIWDDAAKRYRAVFCYKIVVMVNSKNSYGGYTGERQWVLFVRNNDIIQVSSPLY